MSTEDDKNSFQQVLLHDILPGDMRPLATDQVLNIEKEYPGVFVFSPREGQDVATSITELSSDKPCAIISVPPGSKYVQALTVDPVEQYFHLNQGLREHCGLRPMDQYVLVSLYPKVSGPLSNGTPKAHLLSIEQDALKEMAMPVIEQLADPKLGAALLHADDEGRYRASLRDPQSENSQLVMHMIVNARPEPQKLDALRNTAARKGNFEFCARLMDAGELLYPGFAAARRKHSGPTGHGSPGRGV